MTKASTLRLIKTYYGLIKPERTITNTMTAVAGFLFASQWHINWRTFLSLIAGLSLVIASACVFNNYLDRDLDRKMARTKKRALPSGRVSIRSSIVYGTLLGVGGFWILTFTNWLTVAVIATAFISYVVVYGLAKRRSVHSTLIGTVPGGASLVAGYTAFTNQLDSAALILFLIMLSWQMVHFYAIAIYSLKDYTAAKIPILPVKSGVSVTKIYMFVYLILFIFAATLLTWEAHTGYVYLAGVALLSAIWLDKVWRGFTTDDNNRWARDIFKFSLVVLLVMCVLLAVGPVLP